MNETSVFDLLQSSGPFIEHSEKLMLYGQFVGSWSIDSKWYENGRNVRSAKGEWHFQWILGGWGVQDVLFAAGAPSYMYGTTIRCYDKDMDAWHITWMQPYGGEYVYLLGRKIEDRIVQEGRGTNTKRLERWSFLNITAESFSWLGEVSYDDRKEWILEQEMKAVRIHNK